jgi:DNA-binding XRE family transcriptional regulator
MPTLLHRRGPGKGDWYVYGLWGTKVYPGTAHLTTNGFRERLAKEIWGGDPKRYPNKDYRTVALAVLYGYSCIDGVWVEDSKIFGPVLKALREKGEMTQDQLAEKSGVAVATIRDLEQGRRTDPVWTTVCKLASGLEIDLNTLAQAAPAPREAGE